MFFKVSLPQSLELFVILFTVSSVFATAMKGRRSDLVSTSTRYGKAKSNHSHNICKNHSHHQSKFGKTEKKSEIKNVFDEQAEPQDDDLNSGFGDYLRSPEAVEMMKLFVFANTIMLILTMAWPNIKEQYYMFMHWWFQG